MAKTAACTQLRLMMAMTADGKIATRAREAARFTGEEDRRRLEAQVAWADALLMAAGTLRAYGSTFRVTHPEFLLQRADRGQPPQPTSVIVTRSLDLPRAMPFFTRQDVPRMIVTTAPNEDAARCMFSDVAEVYACGEERVDLVALVEMLSQRGMHRVLALGGGMLNFDLVASGLVNELFLTVAPYLFGGADAPTILDGEGFAWEDAVRLELCSCEVVEGEVFLRYRVVV